VRYRITLALIAISKIPLVSSGSAIVSPEDYLLTQALILECRGRPGSYYYDFAGGVGGVTGAGVVCDKGNGVSTRLRVGNGWWAGQSAGLTIAKVPEIREGVLRKVLESHCERTATHDWGSGKFAYDGGCELKVYLEEGVAAVWAVIGLGNGAGSGGEVRVAVAATADGLVDDPPIVKSAGAAIYMLFRERSAPERSIGQTREVWAESDHIKVLPVRSGLVSVSGGGESGSGAISEKAPPPCNVSIAAPIGSKGTNGNIRSGTARTTPHAEPGYLREVGAHREDELLPTCRAISARGRREGTLRMPSTPDVSPAVHVNHEDLVIGRGAPVGAEE